MRSGDHLILRVAMNALQAGGKLCHLLILSRSSRMRSGDHLLLRVAKNALQPGDKS